MKLGVDPDLARKIIFYVVIPGIWVAILCLVLFTCVEKVPDYSVSVEKLCDRSRFGCSKEGVMNTHGWKCWRVGWQVLFNAKPVYNETVAVNVSVT